MNKIVLAFLLLLPISLHAGEHLLLQQFIGPSGDQVNKYKCSYPCEHVIVNGDFNDDSDELIINEHTVFSSAVCGENKMPCDSTLKYSIHISDNSLIRRNKSGGSIIIKSPIKESTKWTVKARSTDKSDHYYKCRISDIENADVLNISRTVVTVECYSDNTKELITTRYASGIGLFERKSEIIKSNEEKILVHSLLLYESKTITE